MQLHVIERNTRFSCACCGVCCNQPWRTVIEADKARALDGHDFGKYPQLAGRPFYHPPADGSAGHFDLAKGEGTRCLFLDTDGLCIIHKELGEAAKPQMCRQFPFISSRTWADERVSVNFGCPSVQAQRGKLLTQQRPEIAEIVPARGEPADPNALIPFDGRSSVTLTENDAIFDQAMEIFGEHRGGSVWDRFSELLDFLRTPAESRVGPANSRSSMDVSIAPRLEKESSVSPFSEPSCAPLPVRMLFAATLQPDTVPADVSGRMGFLGKLSLIPKLMALASLSGTYASRLLGRNVRIEDVMRHSIECDLDVEATRLLLRYFRSRVWLRTLLGTRLSIVGAIHQHIHDFNAILFFARAEAQHAGVPRLTDELIRRGLTLVELHLANQPRLYDQVLKGWLRKQLNHLGVAAQSLRLLAPIDMDPLRMPKNKSGLVTNATTHL